LIHEHAARFNRTLLPRRGNFAMVSFATVKRIQRKACDFRVGTGLAAVRRIHAHLSMWLWGDGFFR
jgi:hypothetical protein